MDQSIGLEGLSLETFEDIVSFLSLRDKAALCQSSHRLHNWTIRHLYSYWEYRGYTQSFRSLHCFLRTTIENPDIGAYVKSLDIREWGNTPPLEDYVGYYGDVEESDNEELYESGGEQVSVADSKSARDSESSKTGGKKNKLVSLLQLEISDEDYERDFHIIRQAIRGLDFGTDWVNNYEQWIRDRDEDALIALLIYKLPNLEILYMVTPEPDIAHRVPELVSKTADIGTPVLNNLHTLYIVSALHIGVKGHREYYLELDRFLPLLGLRSLRSLYTLTSFMEGFPEDISEYSELKRLAGTSTIESLTFDHPENNPYELMEYIRIPRALKSLSISQDISCFSIGSCFHPLYKSYSETLRVHKNSLEHLDLVMYREPSRMFCQEGHAFNPFANIQDKLDLYQSNLEYWKSAHLIGSLKEFITLKTLSIDVTALCGDQNWGESPYQLAEILPQSLQELRLQIYMSQSNMNPEGTPIWALEVEHKGKWLQKLAAFVKSTESTHPNLDMVVIMISFPSPRAAGPPLDSSFDIVSNACEASRIGFKTVEIQRQQIQVPYFSELNEKRNPGRDW